MQNSPHLSPALNLKCVAFGWNGKYSSAMKHGYWQSIAESPTEMFWMKNHSSAYFIMPRWPILGKFMIFIPRFSEKILCSIHQRCQPTPPNFENKSIKVANLSLQASL